MVSACVYPGYHRKSRHPPIESDQDLSELEEGNRSNAEGEEADCSCDSDASECHCGYEDDDVEEDRVAERSVEGSAVELHYELKERKRHVLRCRLG